MASAYRREGSIRREMEAAWQSPSPKTKLPRYDPENDPFCPLAVARRFNHLQREAAVHGTQSLIDTRSASGRNDGKTSRRRRRSRPQSSGGRMAIPPHKQGSNSRGGVITSGSSRSPAFLAPPFIAGATLQLQDGGGFTAVRRPPFSAKGLPSGTQVNEGLARRANKAPGWLTATPVATNKTGIGKASGVEQAAKSNNREGTPVVVELGTDVKEDFATRVARRDDILQDIWLKMHSGEGFARVQGEIAHLLNLYRSATLEILEDMMRHSQLKKIADAYTKKKGDGMRSYREAVIQDADFADGIPEAIAWLGFSTRRNPLFLPPKKKSVTTTISTTPNNKPSSPSDNNTGNNNNDIGLVGGADEQARLRDAQDFVLDQHSYGGSDGGPNADTVPKPGGGGGSGHGASIGGEGLPNDSSTTTVVRPDRPPGGANHKRALRDRVRSINGQLAGAQETIRGLEESLRSREGEVNKRKGRAARVREAAAEARRQKQAKRMYRLRGAAALLEEGVEDLGGEITALRVRLFAERLDVARKRMLKDALNSEMAAKSKTRRRRRTHEKQETTVVVDTVSLDRSAVNSVLKSPATHDERVRADDILRRRDSGAAAAAIQARVRGIRARAETVQVKADKTNAAVRIEAAARGRLVRKQVASERSLSVLDGSVEAVPAVVAAGAATQNRTEEGGNRQATSITFRLASRKGEGPGYEGDASRTRGSRGPEQRESPAAGSTKRASAAVEIEGLEKLGKTGVRALFDSLELGACAGGLRRRPDYTEDGSVRADGDESDDAHESVGIDGIELARIVRSSDPNAELLTIGVGARLHRVKILAALGLDGAYSATTADIGASSSSFSSSSSSVERTPPAVAVAVVSDRVLPVAAPAAAIAALGMVRRLRREQEVIANALSSAMDGPGSALRLPTAAQGRPGDVKAGEEEKLSAADGSLSRSLAVDDNGDTAGMLLRSTSRQTRSEGDADELKHKVDGRALTSVLKRYEGEREYVGRHNKMISVPLRLIPELEQAVCAQAGIFRQVQNVLGFCAEIGSSARKSGDGGVEVRKGRPAAAGIIANGRKTLET